MNRTIRLVRQDFPIVGSGVYLDNASIFPIPLQVVERATEALTECSRHGVRRYEDWLAVIEDTRNLVAQLVNAGPDEIAFTQNTAEGINVVANGISWSTGDNVVITEFDYYANVYPWTRLREFGVDVRFIKPINGLFGPEDLLEHIDARTKVVALSSVQWVNGLRLNLKRFAEIAHSVGALFVVDAIQSLGADPIDVKDANIDFLSSGGHKWLMTPFGTGIFFCKREHQEWLRPSYVGTYSHYDPLDYAFREEQVFPKSAKKFQHGNSNISGIFGLNAAIRYLQDLGLEHVYRRNRMLADIVVKHMSSYGYAFLSPLGDDQRSHFVTFYPRDLESVRSALSGQNIAVSVRMGGIRVSPAFYNTEEEIVYFSEVVHASDRDSGARRSIEEARASE